jgi:hypothetical protein
VALASTHEFDQSQAGENTDELAASSGNAAHAHHVDLSLSQSADLAITVSHRLMTSVSIALSSVSSATIFFSRSFSSFNC